MREAQAQYRIQRSALFPQVSALSILERDGQVIYFVGGDTWLSSAKLSRGRDATTRRFPHATCFIDEITTFVEETHFVM